MSDLTIAASGEVKLGYEVVGTIAFAGPTAHLDVAGDCVSPDTSGPQLPPWVEEQIEDLQEDLHTSKKACKLLEKRVRKLCATLSEVRAMLGVTA